MSHHFQDLLEDLRGRLARMAALVRQALEHALGAVESRNVELAETVISGDRRIDQEEVHVERGAIDLLALYQPAASDLRLIATIIKVNSDLERIADCAVNIAQRVIMLEGNYSFREPPELSQLAESVSTALRNTIQAFNLQDERLARQVLRSDDRIDALYAQIVADMHSFVIDDGEHVILTDAGCGNGKSYPMQPIWSNLDNPFLERLQKAGYGRNDIDTILCTHAHLDHVGWFSMRDEEGNWVPTFPNARLVMVRDEYERHLSQIVSSSEGDDTSAVTAEDDDDVDLIARAFHPDTAACRTRPS